MSGQLLYDLRLKAKFKGSLKAQIYLTMTGKVELIILS